jgi:NAD-dependent dihydropyrimidine dehydrogenase PreA subunit
VLELTLQDDRLVARAVRPEKCSRCYTCVGQCPTRAIQIRSAEEY